MTSPGTHTKSEGRRDERREPGSDRPVRCLRDRHQRHRRRWVSACLRDHLSATASRSGLRYQAIRSAPGRVMFAAPMASRCLTFSSFAASFSSETDSHCCRSPSSCQTARHRPPLSRGGYTVIRRSSSITSPSPRVAARVSKPATRPAARPVSFGFAAVALRVRLAGPRAGCGDFEDRGWCLRHLHFLASSLPAFPQVGGLTLAV